MSRPAEEIDACRLAHAKLNEAVRALADASRPSLLPGWTVGHVLAHLTQNPDSMCRRIDGAIRGERVEQYDGGVAGRANDIEAAASLGTEQLAADLHASSQRLDDLFEALLDHSWPMSVKSATGSEVLVAALPFRRWREVEIHLVDLDIGFTPASWPDGLVTKMYPRLIEGLAKRAVEHDLVAWMLARGPSPDLRPWVDMRCARSGSGLDRPSGPRWLQLLRRDGLLDPVEELPGAVERVYDRRQLPRTRQKGWVLVANERRAAEERRQFRQRPCQPRGPR